MPSNTLQFLEDYHDASKRLAASALACVPPDEDRELFVKLTTAARELISRCILSNDPRSLFCLIGELTIVMRVLGQSKAAKCLHAANYHLAEYYKKFGTF